MTLGSEVLVVDEFVDSFELPATYQLKNKIFFMKWCLITHRQQGYVVEKSIFTSRNSAPKPPWTV